MNAGFPMQFVRQHVLIVFLLAASASAVGAQSPNSIIIGGGRSLPAGVLNSYADNGWNITAGVEHRFGGHPTSLRLDLSYSADADTSGVGFHEMTRLITGMVNVVYHLPGAHPRIYLLLGAGVMQRRFTSADPFDTGIKDSFGAFQIGEGVDFRVGRLALFLEGRYVSAVGPEALKYFPVILGVRIGDRRQ